MMVAQRTAARNRSGSKKNTTAAVNNLLKHSGSVLIFIFFALSPLVVFPGFSAQGELYCTLYNLPKTYFIAAYSLLLAGYLCLLLGLRADVLGNGNRFTAPVAVKLLGLLLVCMLLSRLQAQVPAVAWFIFFNYVCLVILFLALSQFFTLTLWRWRAVYGLIVASVVFVSFGLAQFYGVKIPFLMPISTSFASTFGYRNPAAHFIALVLPFVIFAAMRHLRFWRSRGGRLQITLFCFLLWLALALLLLLFMNSCRTAIMALLLEALVVPLFWFVSSRKGAGETFVGGVRGWLRPLCISLLIIVVLVSLIMVFPKSRKRVAGSINRFQRGGVSRLLEARYYHWGNTLMMIKENPFSGVGIGNWHFTYPLYYRSFARDPLINYRMTVGKAHNDYLQLAAECGIPALLLFLLLWGRQFYLLRYSTTESDDEEDWRLPLAASLLAFSVIMFFSFPMQMAYSRMFCFFLLALGEARAWPALSS